MSTKEELLMKVLEMLLNGSDNKESTSNTLQSAHVGKFVLIRTYSAGVHIGKLVKRENMEAMLDDARRIWSWDGAFTLSKVASDGVGSGKLSTRVDGFLATQVIEVLPLTEKAKDNLYGIEDHAG